MSNKFNNSTTWQDTPQDTTTTAPARAASFQSDVLVPLGQALVTALAVAVCGSGMVWAAVQAYQTQNLLYVPLALLQLVFVLSWGVLLLSHRRLLWAVESLTHRDLDHDGSVGQPKQTLGVAVEDSAGATHFWDAEWLGLTDQQLVNWARALRIHNRKLTEKANAKDKASFPGGLAQFREVRTKLQSAGAVRRKSDGQTSTFELTQVGEVGFDRILEYAEE